MKKFQIEKVKFDTFLRDFALGNFPYLRLGQAFYNEMNLYKMTDQGALGNLFEAEGNQVHISNF